MRPVPLTDPTGAVCTWRCGRCGQVYTAKMVEPLDDLAAYLAWQGEQSEPQAEWCCRCHECQVELPYGEQSGECDVCARISQLRAAEWHDENARNKLARGEILRAHTVDVATARELSDLSEHVYCAGWLIGLEFILRRYVVEGPDPEPRHRGHGFDSAVREAEVEELRRLSDAAGGWWRWDEAFGGEVFVTMAEWRERYASRER